MSGPQHRADRCIVVLMGVAGVGKTTIGRRLAQELSYEFLDADSLHSRACIEKMQAGHPLSDADRAPWLARTHAQMLAAWRRGVGLVVACSALKQSYRDELARGIAVRWIHLTGSAELVEKRLSSRTDHFMRTEMLASQLRDIEAPDDAVVIDIAAPPEDIVSRVIAALQRS